MAWNIQNYFHVRGKKRGELLRIVSFGQRPLIGRDGSDPGQAGKLPPDHVFWCGEENAPPPYGQSYESAQEDQAKKPPHHNNSLPTIRLRVARPFSCRT